MITSADMPPFSSNRDETLRALFSEMLSTVFPGWHNNWHARYKELCMEVSRADHIDDTLLHALLRETRSNGVASAGQSLLTSEMYGILAASTAFRNTVDAFKKFPDESHFLQMKTLADDLAAQHHHKRFPLRINRVAIACNTSLSSIPHEQALRPTLQWMEQNGLLDFEPIGNWFLDNLHATQSLTPPLSPVPGYDIWSRNMFLWWLYQTFIQKPDIATTETLPMSPAPDSAIPHSLNTILYGPPGTGKTHDVVTRALAILEPGKQQPLEYAVAKARFDKLKQQGRIAFVTFHQSYGYEDFIEGIRPILDDGTEASVSYRLHDGVFKAFCKRARGPSAKSMTDFGLNANPVIWKVSLAGTGDNETRRDCLKNGYIRIGWDDYGPAIDPESLQSATVGRFVLGAFVDGMSKGDIVLSCWSATEIDAIGVVEGEYEWHDEFAQYKRLRKVRWLVKDIRENVLALNGDTKLTLATVYRLNRMQLSDVLALVAKHQGNADIVPPQNNPLPFVFVIDEINRGNISKIFGELITLVEPSKRLGAVEAAKAILPYSGEEFGVPPNVYILGTMNTADRSIALLDTALRRRFDFVEMMPQPELLSALHPNGIDLQTMLATINARIEFLLDREHTIGHAYFLGAFAANPTLDGLADIFRNRIVPLLQEYFFEDYAKIRLVLGDASFKRKAKQFQFVQEKTGQAKELFPGVPDDFGGPVDAEHVLYRINAEAFTRPQSYIGIYKPIDG